MLVDTEYNFKTKKLLVSYVDTDGEIKVKYINWENPTKYVVCDESDPDKDPQYTTWDKKPIKKVSCANFPGPDKYAIYEFLDHLPQDEQDEIFAFNIPNIYFIDIETEIVDGFPEAEDIFDKEGNLEKEGAATRVLSISIVYQDKIILLGLEDMPDDMQRRILTNTNKYFEGTGNDYKFKYIKYNDEFDMLHSFFNKMVPKMSVLTGWNFLEYDWKFLINRSKKLRKIVNGKEYTIKPESSSITNRLITPFGSNYEIPAHRMIFDYMQMYEIFDKSIKVKESSSLDFVSSKIVGLDKIKYNGSLQKLYEEDFETFMYYNAVDSVLVQKIHESMDYISIAFAIASLSRIKAVEVISYFNKNLGTLAITEGVLRGRYREEQNVILFRDKDKKIPENSKSISGGWVKEPVKGLNNWCVTYDFASLYPRTQLQFFISPENLVGMVDPRDSNMCTNGVMIEKSKHVVCLNNTVFKKEMSPTLHFLEDVYADRKKNKKIMMDKKEELKKVLDELNELKNNL